MVAITEKKTAKVETMLLKMINTVTKMPVRPTGWTDIGSKREVCFRHRGGWLLRIL